MNTFLGFKTEEILTCLLLIVVGYFIAKMFSGCGCSNNGFSVGIRKKDGNTCKEGDRCYSLQDSEYAYKCPTTGICHNLVIDDGTVVPCRNPEGVYVGSSNHTYCIQDESNPVNPVNPVNPIDPNSPKSKCINKNRIWAPNNPGSNPNDQYGGKCTTCIIKKADVNNDCKECTPPFSGMPTCNICKNGLYDISSDCTQCTDKKRDPNNDCGKCALPFSGMPNCIECENDLHNKNRDCKECINKSLVYPDCNSPKPCNELSLLQCPSHVLCESKGDKCVPIKGDCSYDEQNCNSANSCFWGSVAKGKKMCHNKIVSGGVCTVDDRCLSGKCKNKICE